MDYVVVWDGSHRNVNADLLCCPAVPLTRIDVPLGITDETQADPAYEAVRLCLARESYSSHELREMTGFSLLLIKLALERLRRQRVLESLPIPAQDRGVGLPWVRYRIVES